jgi:hypothetical protein
MTKLTDKEQALLSQMVEDHLWRQSNYLRGSEGEHTLYPKLKARALQLKKKLTDFVVDV